ncbi:MAG: MFS transporter [Balneolales bacterium]
MDYRAKKILLIIGMVLIALNLRPALAGVGPLISDIRDATGLSNAMLGLLTSLPLMAFGILSALTRLVSSRLGIERTIALALGLLAGGVLLRVIPGNPALFGGTLLVGVAIAFGNVLLPTLVKRDFPNHSGILTSIYSSMLGLGAALASGVSVPLAHDWGWGWRWSLGAWAIPALAALLIWLPQLKNVTIPQQNIRFIHSFKVIIRSKMAWNIAVYMGLQSFAFYVVLAWLPEIFQHGGLSPNAAGWMLSLSQGTGVAGSLLIPALAAGMTNQRIIVWILMICEAVSIIGLMLPYPSLMVFWAGLIGFSLGGCFGLALLFLVLRSNDTETANELSGMVLSIGFIIAASGPALFGALYDWTQVWNIPLFFLLMIAVLKLLSGLGASQPRFVK